MAELAAELAAEAGLAGLAGGLATAMRAAGRERIRCSRGMMRRRPSWTPGLRGTWLEYKLGRARVRARVSVSVSQVLVLGLGLGLGLGFEALLEQRTACGALICAPG